METVLLVYSATASAEKAQSKSYVSVYKLSLKELHRNFLFGQWQSYPYLNNPLCPGLLQHSICIPNPGLSNGTQ